MSRDASSLGYSVTVRDCQLSFPIETVSFKPFPQRDPPRSATLTEKHGKHPSGVYHQDHEEVGQGEQSAYLNS